ncbi:hypothetical protein [Propionivibrio dicarboxylicus]|uniref:Uncharacterized protein n=1 Tax=Propionivibrio dicarboxylicus TaxID=83767 RepID=A0A1G8I5G5_9RHOO|nr:hypothetical protein [Propionivibrio dicarboxylicus]SDI14077.1 hypothetical protein SAMN05660652_02935 [Propionivibrio dicarboxylicus]
MNSLSWSFHLGFGWPRMRQVIVWVCALFFSAVLPVRAQNQAQEASTAAIVTAIHGSVDLVTAQGVAPLQPFARIKSDESLRLQGGALVRLLFLASGRQETWRGNGKIDIREAQGLGSGLPAPETTMLAVAVVRQIARTPSDLKFVRQRSLAMGNSLEKVEETYRRMRMEAVRGDLNPELYLLSALFEMREIDRVEQLLSELRDTRRGDQEAQIVVALYQKALKNLKDSGKRL